VKGKKEGGRAGAALTVPPSISEGKERVVSLKEGGRKKRRLSLVVLPRVTNGRKGKEIKIAIEGKKRKAQR